ncbi:MAG: fumarylacetoacetate hydrolase family protein [Bacteroidales bacterium]|nr:fumarylacetoacetate hydrolase family protein [Bacteroidales bacterium]MCF8398526.1 fumarylacetoacetate hydrolase family protein [Bacteroidales bacterium]
MKIICIGRNYVEHARELNNPLPKEPVFFLKPDSAILRRNHPFYYPDFSNEIHFETELVLKICKVGRHIPERFASSYYKEIGIGIDFTARDLQRKCKEKGLPWEIAKAFDFSAPLGKFLIKDELADTGNISFSLKINNEIRQDGNSSNMIFSFDQIIAYVSKFITLKMGDLIFTGTPEGVGPVKRGDRLQAYIEDKKLLDFPVR